ncbi:phage holin family protein [Salinimicrobium tongyeongense]|uniref:Phage holin family protein n=1 Tax=Salinimicrobium tongyeongense TaxID=2809707 RepID=A0ABY6NUQ3_9FLAO|nr:phage holin family protein [Salinimicrobium tongyeongense]UZH56646.1 phage holin family protein [Salinimicrobium tongyeongense]
MAFGRISNNIQELKENIRAFAHSSAEYYKLDLFNKSMQGAIAAIKGVAIALFALFFVLFLSIAVAVALSNWIDSPSSGFFIVAGLYLLLVLFFVFFGSKVLMKAILPGASKKFFQEPQKKPENKEHHEFTPQKDFETDEIIIKDNERV